MNKVVNNSQKRYSPEAGKALDEFQKKYPTKAAREKALKGMSNAQIDTLVEGCGTMQGKIYYSSFKEKSKGKK